MRGKPSGPAGRAPRDAGEWEAPETEEESVTENAQEAETELEPCGMMRNGLRENGGLGWGRLRRCRVVSVLGGAWTPEQGLAPPVS